MREDTIVRIDPARHDEALAEPQAWVFDLSGRPMKGRSRIARAEDRPIRPGSTRTVDEAR